jgi:hypothetical protein
LSEGLVVSKVLVDLLAYELNFRVVPNILMEEVRSVLVTYLLLELSNKKLARL